MPSKEETLKLIANNEESSEDQTIDAGSSSNCNSYEIEGPRLIANNSQTTHSIYKPGSLNQISSEFESLDYDPYLNSLWLDERRNQGYRHEVTKDAMRWCIVFFIGVLTAVVACIIDMSIEVLSSYKFKLLQSETERCAKEGCLIIPFILWLITNGVPVFFAAVLGSYIEPMAAGSGIPQVKCYLNGVKIPRVVRIKTLFTKVLGVTLSVLGGLAVGKEGPMIHSGAVIAAGISQGKTTTFNYDFGLFKEFREDTEKRDFVSAGAAAGVAAAFGAPVGGVLFSLEEGASFWNQVLTWRVFFSALVSCFTLNIVLSAFKGHLGDLNNPGLINFGKFEDLNYEFYEFIPFIIMAALGGLQGALFNQCNYYISIFRIRYLNRPWQKVLEAVTVAMVTATVGFIMIYSIRDCRDIDTEKEGYPVQLFCKKGEESTTAMLLFKTPENCLISLFHDPKHAYGWVTMSVFFVVYFFLALWTYGLCVPSGLFIPTLLAGASSGRLCGMLMGTIFPNQAWVDEGKYALVGAAAMLGGVVRMTISLTVILMECVGNITFGLPLMIVVMISKWVGDFFNEGIYDIHVRLSGAPLMPWDPPPLSDNIFASEVMSRPVVTVNVVESVQNVYDILRNCPHNGFPVIDPECSLNPSSPKEQGRLRGLITRSQLMVLLKYKVFNENASVWTGDFVNMQLFRDAYPRFPTLDDVEISPQDLLCTFDLRPIMNPSPYAVTAAASFQRMFRLFRALGLRHLVVLNDEHRVVGIVTRKDLVRFRVFHARDEVSLRQLEVYDEPLLTGLP